MQGLHEREVRAYCVSAVLGELAQTMPRVPAVSPAHPQELDLQDLHKLNEGGKGASQAATVNDWLVGRLHTYLNL